MSAKGVKQPMYIHPAGEAPFAFAALWESWRAKDASSAPSVYSWISPNIFPKHTMVKARESI